MDIKLIHHDRSNRTMRAKSCSSQVCAGLYFVKFCVVPLANRRAWFPIDVCLVSASGQASANLCSITAHICSRPLSKNIRARQFDESADPCLNTDGWCFANVWYFSDGDFCIDSSGAVSQMVTAYFMSQMLSKEMLPSCKHSDWLEIAACTVLKSLRDNVVWINVRCLFSCRIFGLKKQNILF